MELEPTWTHTICEICWFIREPNRFPVQIKREPGDYLVDACCVCGQTKVTRIYMRENPKSPHLRYCHGEHPPDDEDE